MSDPIQEAIARANAAKAAAVANTPAPSTAVAIPVAGVPAVAVAPQKFSMESMAAGSMSVDKWFKVTEDGLKIGDSKLIIGGVKATLDMTDGSGFVLKMAIKGGNPAQYAYTTDNVNATAGGSWEGAMARIRALDPRANPYRAVDLPFTLTEDVKDMGGVLVGKAGDTVGYTTSTTNWANWATFYKAVADADLINQKVLVLLTQQPRTNSNQNKWGVIKFELLGAAE